MRTCGAIAARHKNETRLDHVQSRLQLVTANQLSVITLYPVHDHELLQNGKSWSLLRKEVRKAIPLHWRT